MDLTFETWPIERCIDYIRNPRKNDHAVDKVAAAIREFGFRVPIVAKSDGLVVDGHLRLKAAKKLGLAEVPVILADDMSEAQIKAFRLSVNKVAELAEWDNELLGLEIMDLKDMGFDIDLIGFDADEINALFPEEPTAGLTDEDAVPEVPEQPVTVDGDVWLLGRHRLMCGDSTSIDAVDRLMDGRKADMVFTDPPYGIDFAPQRGTHGKILNDALEGQEFDGFLDAVFGCAYAAMKPDTYAFVWTGWPKIGAFERALQKVFKIQAMHIWVKNNFGIGYYSRPKHEPFYLCLNGKPVYPANAPADVWEAKKVHKTVHSCEKPVDLIVNILDTYHKNSTVLDLFGGSGSTLIACEKTARDCRMMELDPKYCDVIIKRWQDFTGQQATLEATGQTYDELKADREAA
jgi:DNA modification methylase